MLLGTFQTIATSRSGHAHALGVRRFIAANNRYMLGGHNALPAHLLPH